MMSPQQVIFTGECPRATRDSLTCVNEPSFDAACREISRLFSVPEQLPLTQTAVSLGLRTSLADAYPLSSLLLLTSHDPRIRKTNASDGGLPPVYAQPPYVPSSMATEGSSHTPCASIDVPPIAREASSLWSLPDESATRWERALKCTMWCVTGLTIATTAYTAKLASGRSWSELLFDEDDFEPAPSGTAWSGALAQQMAAAMSRDEESSLVSGQGELGRAGQIES